MDDNAYYMCCVHINLLVMNWLADQQRHRPIDFSGELLTGLKAETPVGR